MSSTRVNKFLAAVIRIRPIGVIVNQDSGCGSETWSNITQIHTLQQNHTVRTSVHQKPDLILIFYFVHLFLQCQFLRPHFITVS